MEKTIEVQSSQYRTIHNWVLRHYGKAIKCESIECNKKYNEYEWALKKGCGYEKDISNFIQLCTSCHRKYDISEMAKQKGRQNFIKGRIARRRPVNQLNSEGLIVREYESVSQAAKANGRSHSSLLQAIKKKSLCNKFNWEYA